MAVGTTFTFGGQVAGENGVGSDLLKEDVLQLIFQITPTDTPFFQMIGESNSTQPLTQWPTREFSTRQDNAFIEGSTFAFGEPVVALFESNNQQIFENTIRVSETAQASDLHAINNVFEDQAKVRMLQHKTAIEHALIVGKRTLGDVANARRMDGLIEALSRSSLWTQNTTSTLTEVALNDMFQTIWDNGVVATDMLVNSALKRRISGFAGLQTVGTFASIAPTPQINRDMTVDRLVNTISIYETDLANARIHISRDLKDFNGVVGIQTAVAFIRENFKKSFLRRTSLESLPKTADSRDGVVISELTLTYGNIKAGGFLSTN